MPILRANIRRRRQPRHLHHPAPAQVDPPRGSTAAEEPPKWWKTQVHGQDLTVSSKIANCLLRIICLLTLGHPSLNRLWDLTKPGHDDTWASFKEGLASRTSNMNIVAGLILTSTAVFLTTPPPLPNLLEYTSTAPYICLLASFVMAMISIGSGSFLLFVVSEAKAASFRSLVRTRIRLWFVLYMIGSPSLWVGCSGITAIIGLSWSAWLADNAFSKAGVTLAILLVVLQCGTFAILVA